MQIKHRPILDTKVVEEYYREKDGVPVKYVCTTAFGNGTVASDVFYRDTPHPVFGNKYFGILRLDGFVIHSADNVEDLVFDMLDTPSGYYYSQHRHDYVSVGDYAIDGGRAYTRLIGSPEIKTFKVRNGVFV